MTVGKWLLLKLSALKSKYITLSITMNKTTADFLQQVFWQIFWLLMAPFSTLFFPSNHHSISRKNCLDSLTSDNLTRFFSMNLLCKISSAHCSRAQFEADRRRLNCVAQLAPCALVLFSFVLILICCSVPSLAARQMCEYQGDIN